jgi:HEAT repeat protein
VQNNNKQVGVSPFFFFLFPFFLLFIFGCNELAQTTIGRSDTAFVSNLMPEAARIIRQALADDNPQIRANAIEVVAAAKRVELMPEVQRLLKDEFVPVRFTAALAVGDLKYTPAEEPVKQLLKDPDENVRIAAAYAAAELGFPDSFGLVRRAITSSNQTVRANAALVLGKSGGKNTIKLLYWALRNRNSDDKVRLQVIEAIAMLGDEQILKKKLWSMVYSAYNDEKIIGIRAMGALGTTKARDILITKLDDDVLEVRLAAAEQLGAIGSTTGEPEVLDVFTKNLTAGLDKEGLERVNVLTASAIGRIGTAPLTKFLPRLLKDNSKFVRIAAARAVFQCQMAN